MWYVNMTLKLTTAECVIIIHMISETFQAEV